MVQKIAGERYAKGFIPGRKLEADEIWLAWAEFAEGKRTELEIGQQAIDDILTAGRAELFQVVDTTIRAITGRVWERHPTVDLTPGFGIDRYNRAGDKFGPAMAEAIDQMINHYEAGMLACFALMNEAFESAEVEQAGIARREQRRKERDGEAAQDGGGRPAAG